MPAYKMNKEVNREVFLQLLIDYAEQEELRDMIPNYQFWIDTETNEICFYAVRSHIERVEIDFCNTELKPEAQYAIAKICRMFGYKYLEAQGFIEAYQYYLASLEEVTPYNIHPGRTIYEVNNGTISEYDVLSYPYPKKVGSYASLCIKVRSNSTYVGTYETEIFLSDSGIMTPDCKAYNDHRSFYNKDLAIAEARRRGYNV